MAIPACTAEAGSGTDAETVQVPGTLLVEIPVRPKPERDGSIVILRLSEESPRYPITIVGPVSESNESPMKLVTKAPVNLLVNSAGSMIWRPRISDSYDGSRVQEDVGEAGGDERVIVAPISPGFGAPVPSVNPYVTVPAWQGKLAGASDRATPTRATAK